MPGEHATIREINDQPAALEAVVESLDRVEPTLHELLSGETTFCLTGCGTSYYLSLSGNAVLNEVASSIAIPGSEALVSPHQLPEEVDVILPVSRSGESTETVRATEALREQYPNATILGLTCTEGSTIHDLADVPILSPEGGEESVVMTKSFSSMLATFEYIARVIETDDLSVTDGFASLPADSERLISKADPVARDLAGQEFEKSVFLGSGETFGIASEAMLKAEEMTLSWTKAYHTLEFRHGPQSIADEDTLVTVFLPNRRLDLQADLLADVADLGATSLAVGTAETLEAIEADYAIELPKRDTGSLPLYAPPFQLLGYYRAVEAGLDPDEPQNLTQVVEL